MDSLDSFQNILGVFRRCNGTTMAQDDDFRIDLDGCVSDLLDLDNAFVKSLA